MSDSTAGTTLNQCPHCGYYHGPMCPYVRSVEYYQNGAVKKVEYVTPRDYLPKQNPYGPPHTSSPCLTEVSTGSTGTTVWKESGSI